MKRPTKAEREAQRWNERHPVGTTVRYWTWLREGEPSGVGETTHRAAVLGGSAVVWIRGCKRGCVALSHVEVVDDRQLELGGLQ